MRIRPDAVRCFLLTDHVYSTLLILLIIADNETVCMIRSRSIAQGAGRSLPSGRSDLPAFSGANCDRPQQTGFA